MSPDQIAKAVADHPCEYLTRDDGKPSMMVVTCPARLSYTFIGEPDQKGRYRTTVILPDDADISALRKAAGEAAKEFFGDKLESEAFRAKLKSPFKPKPGMIDDEGKRRPAFEGDGVFFEAHSKFDPEQDGALFDEACQPCGGGKFYSGCWARVRVRFKGYDQDGNRGVTAYLSGLQFFADDEKLTGSVDKGAGFTAFRPAQNPLANGADTSAGSASSADLF